MIIAFKIFTGITVYLICYNWFLINYNNIYCIKFNNRKKKKKKKKIDECNYVNGHNKANKY